MKNNDKFFQVGAKNSRNLAVLALLLSLGFSGNALAACNEGDRECGTNCCATITTSDGVDINDNPLKHAEIYKDPAATENANISIGRIAFQGLNLTSVTIPEGVTDIGDRAFMANKITSVNLPNSLNSIGQQSFLNNKLTSIVIPNGVTTVGASAFQNNSLLTSVVLPETVSKINNSTFANAQVNNLVISDSMDKSKWGVNAYLGIVTDVTIQCIGDVEKCKESLPSRFKDKVVELDSENEAQRSLCTGQYTWQNGKCRQISETACNQSDKYYFNGSDCKTRTAGGKITCKNSSYKANDGYCDRIRYTPADAAKVVRDGNNNQITITFKK